MRHKYPVVDISIFSLLGFILFAVLSDPAKAVIVPGDYPTIQAALDDVMFGTLPSGTVIDVQPGVYFESIAYSNSSKSILLRGVAGAANTVIDASGTAKSAITSRDVTGSVEIKGFTITGTNSAIGGGITFERASPKLSDCVVENNSTDNDGGGIFLYSSNAVISNCIVRNNTAANSGGGLIMVAGSRPQILSSRFENNIAGADSSVGGGGGIQINDSSPVIRSAVITGNRSAFAGGGIFLIGIFDSPNGVATLTLENSEVSYNTAMPFGGASLLIEGGGIHVEDNAMAQINNSIISHNTAEQGGGLTAFRSRIDVFDSFIESNEATRGSGGGIHAFSVNPQASVINLVNSVVRNNNAVNAGGILVAGQSCGSGGVCASLRMEGSLIDSNIASIQGGGINISDAVMSVSKSQILRNQVTAISGGGYGGGVRIVESNATILDSAIANNLAGERGGGFFLENGSELFIDKSYIYNNSTTAVNGGGGLFVGQNGPPSGSIINSVIADNSDFQIRENACPPALSAPILSYEYNTITDLGASKIYMSPCFPPGEVTDISVFNGLSPGNKTVGNSTGNLNFTSFMAVPPQAPSVLAWSVARAATVNISNVVDPQPGPINSLDVNPPCTTTYVLNGLPATVTNTAIAPPPACSGQNTNLFDQQLSSSQVFEAEKAIYIQRVTLLPNADIKFRAGEKVVITAPFSVQMGARLQVETDPCLCE